MSSNDQQNVNDRKLFAGGLTWGTTENQLKEYFEKYGQIESINLKTDPNTGKSRGFAFIVFSSVNALDAVLNAGEHTINNKKVDTTKAKVKQGKIFVGGLVSEISDDDIKNHFAKFGNVVQVDLPFDKVKNQRKAFCFVTFENEQVALGILKSRKQTINGKEVDVKRATPNTNQGGGRDQGYAFQNWNQGYEAAAYGGYDQFYGGGFDGGYGGFQPFHGAGRGRGQRYQPY